MKKNKDIDILFEARYECNKKIQDIKKRKRSLEMLIDPDLKKKIRKDLKREYRSVKHSEKQTIAKFIKNEIEDLKNKN